MNKKLLIISLFILLTGQISFGGYKNSLKKLFTNKNIVNLIKNTAKKPSVWILNPCSIDLLFKQQVKNLQKQYPEQSLTDQEQTELEKLNINPQKIQSHKHFPSINSLTYNDKILTNTKGLILPSNNETKQITQFIINHENRHATENHYQIFKYTTLPVYWAGKLLIKGLFKPLIFFTPSILKTNRLPQFIGYNIQGLTSLIMGIKSITEFKKPFEKRADDVINSTNLINALHKKKITPQEVVSIIDGGIELSEGIIKFEKNTKKFYPDNKFEKNLIKLVTKAIKFIDPHPKWEERIKHLEEQKIAFQKKYPESFLDENQSKIDDQLIK